MVRTSTSLTFTSMQLHNEEQFCEIIFNLDQWFTRKRCLRRFISRALAALLLSELNHLRNSGKGFYEIIMNLGQWFRRRWRLKYLLSGALLFSEAEPFMQFWNRASWGIFM